ncbi:glycosyltransferase [Kistimonas asteriae]|uniref:glycosyltransferase n=1 Tax=Kistimonas asteriae TaxID=517724 RepID=UPI001BAC955E|nr:glycosyltransferase [Kistimonas asteriae]
MTKAMMRFATLLSPAESGGEGYQNGLRVANVGFIQALVRYSEFSEFHLFVVADDCPDVDAYWSQYLLLNGLDAVIQVFPLHLLPMCLSEYDYSVFHSGDHYIAPLLELREAYASRLFPVTGRVHSLCQDVSLSTTRNLCLSPQKACDALLCASDAAQQAMEKLMSNVQQQLDDRHGIAIRDHCRIEYLPLGVESSDFPPINKTLARQTLELPEDATIILYLGRIDAGNKMDLHPLILALSEVVNDEALQHLQDIVLYICGQSSASDDYVVSLARTAGQLVIEDRVLFNFEMAPDERSTIYAAADIFVSLADNPQETFGLAPLEAMATGLPVVLSDWDGYRDLVDHGHSGYLIPTSWGDIDALVTPTAYYEPERNLLASAQAVAVDVAALSQVLINLVADKNQREQVGAAGQRRVEEQFSWSVSVSCYMALVERLGQLADSMTFQPSGRYPGLPMTSVFGHYSSSMLDDSVVVETLPRGRRVLMGSEAAICFDGINHLVDAQLQTAVLEGALLGARVDQLCAHIALARPLVIFNILWGLKHHLLTQTAKGPVIEPRRYVQLADAGKTTDSFAQNTIWQILQTTEYPDEWTSGLIQPVINRYLHPLLENMLNVDQWQIDEVIPTLMAPLVVHLCEQLNQLKALCSKSVITMDPCQWSVQALLDHFPMWGRQLKAGLVADLQAIKAVLRRLNNDSQSLIETFVVSDNQDGIRITGLDPLTDQGFQGTTLVSFSNGGSILYKPRDLRIEARLVNRHQENEALSLAELLNQWAGEPVIGCLQHIAKVETLRHSECHYGYSEYLDSNTPRSEWSEPLYRRMGWLSAFLLITGQGDAHHNNILVKGEMPYLVDAKRSLSHQVVAGLAEDIANGNGVMLEMSSLSKTRVGVFWEESDDIADDTHQHSQHASVVAEGFRQALQLIMAQSGQIVRFFKGLSGLPVCSPLLTHHQHRQQISDISKLHVFCEPYLGALYQTARIMADRMIREYGKTEGCNEPVARHRDDIVRDWVRGNIPCFYRVTDSIALLTVPNDRADRYTLLDADYFPTPVLPELAKAIKDLDQVACDKLAGVYENWLLSLAVEEPLEANLLQWLQKEQ